MRETIRETAVVPDEATGERADRVAASLFPAYSRARLQAWMRDGALTLDGRALKPKTPVTGGQTLVLDATLAVAVPDAPEPLPLAVVYEDASLLVVNKPPGQVVHPAVGHASGTLLNALLHYAPEVETLPRAGIVHRLDKDTSGLLVVARTLPAHHSLVAQLQARTVKREYLALVQGEPTGGGRIDAPIGRHPRQRQKMAVVAHGGKPAVTHYRIEERLAGLTLLRVSLETGRTHQIRVHLAHRGYPLVGDPLYGGRLKQPPGASPAVREALRAFRRQALHAAALGLMHPDTGEAMAWTAPLPDDLAHLLAVLREAAAS